MTGLVEKAGNHSVVVEKVVLQYETWPAEEADDGRAKIRPECVLVMDKGCQRSGNLLLGAG